MQNWWENQSWMKRKNLQEMQLVKNRYTKWTRNSTQQGEKESSRSKTFDHASPQTGTQVAKELMKDACHPASAGTASSIGQNSKCLNLRDPVTPENCCVTTGSVQVMFSAPSSAKARILKTTQELVSLRMAKPAMQFSTRNHTEPLSRMPHLHPDRKGQAHVKNFNTCLKKHLWVCTEHVWVTHPRRQADTCPVSAAVNSSKLPADTQGCGCSKEELELQFVSRQGTQFCSCRLRNRLGCARVRPAPVVCWYHRLQGSSLDSNWHQRRDDGFTGRGLTYYSIAPPRLQIFPRS